jgi:hypothetical protein
MMRLRYVAPLACAIFSLCFISGTAFAKGKSADAKSRQFGIGQPKNLSELPYGKFKNQLLGLPPRAQSNALRWMQGLSFPAEDARSMRVTKNGEIHYADMFTVDHVDSSETGEVEASNIAVDLSNVFRLHSLPGSNNVLYLDFDGHVLKGTGWSGSTLYALPFDPSGNDIPATEANFTDDELTRIFEIWHRVSEDFAAFNIDVTTEEPPVFTPTTGRILFTHDTDASGASMPYQGAGGVAFTNVFGNDRYASTYSPAFVYYTNLSTNDAGIAHLNAEAASHEFGHNLGLSHDGTTTGNEYYTGHGEGMVSWAPVMGLPYRKSVTQWSRGEYPYANNDQDDLSVIAAKLGYVGDDHGSTTATATPLYVEPNGDILVSSPQFDPHNHLDQNKGVIDDVSDTDWFSLDLDTEGRVALTATPAWHSFRTDDGRGSNLDIELTLLAETLGVVASSDPINDTNATIDVAVPAGRYFVQIRGVGNQEASSYSEYASTGMYFLEGLVETAQDQPVDSTPPTPGTMTWQIPPRADGTASIVMRATIASDDSGYVEYYFSCVAGGTGCKDSGWQISPDFIIDGLSADTYYAFNVKARDGSGNENEPSAAAGTTTEALPIDSTSPTPSTMSWQIPPYATGTDAIAMEATQASDDSGYVEYYFACVTGGSECVDSGWQTSRSYVAEGLSAGSYYEFTVTARDASGNENTASPIAGATTEETPVITENADPIAIAQISPSEPVIKRGNAVTVTLDGAKSHDTDGYIVSWQWFDVTDQQVGEAEILSQKLREGSYIYRLIITDNEGGTAEAEVTFSVTKPAESPRGKPPKG